MSQSHVVCTYWIEESFGSMDKHARYHIQTSLTIEGIAASLAANGFIPWFDTYRGHVIDNDLCKFLSKDHAVIFDSISHYGPEHLCSVEVWWNGKWEYSQFMPRIRYMPRLINRNVRYENYQNVYTLSAGENFCFVS